MSTLIIRLTDDQKAAIRAAATSYGLSMTAYVIYQCVTAADPTKPITIKPTGTSK